jgi:BRCA1-associated protein
MTTTSKTHLYSIVIAVHPSEEDQTLNTVGDWRLGDIQVDWVDFTREKSIDKDQYHQQNKQSRMTQSTEVSSGRKKSSKPSASTSVERKKKPSDPDSLSLQPLLAHFPGPNPLDSSVAQGTSHVGRGVVHLFRHAPPAHLIASLESHPVGEGSGSGTSGTKSGGKDEWSGERAEGEDGSLIAILAVPAWMRPADFLEFIGGWGTCLEGVRMIR